MEKIQFETRKLRCENYLWLKKLISLVEQQQFGINILKKIE